MSDLVGRELPTSCQWDLDLTGWSLIVGDGEEDDSQIVITIEPLAKGADMIALGRALQKIGEELSE